MVMASRTQMVLLSAILLLLVPFRAATATEFIVGGESGWTVPIVAVNGLDYTSWANSTNFVVGDSLVFNYDPKFHSVLSVTGAAFATCNTSEPLEAWTDGNTTVTLEKAGRYWFICGAPNHCSLGQGFKVTVSAAPAVSPASAPQSGAGNVSIKASKAVVILLSIVVGICLL